MKKLNTGLFSAFILIILGALLVSGATVALFTDTAENTDNTFAAGTLRIELTEEFGETWDFDYTNIAPGDSDFGIMVVENVGSLNLWYRIDVLDKDGFLLVGGSNPMEFTFEVVTLDENGDVVSVITSLTPGTGARELDVGQSEAIRVTWELPIEADDTYQNTSGTLGITLIAEQFANNDPPFTAP